MISGGQPGQKSILEIPGDSGDTRSKRRFFYIVFIGFLCFALMFGSMFHELNKRH